MKKYIIILAILLPMQGAIITATTPRASKPRGIDWAYIGEDLPPYAQDHEAVYMTDWNY